MNEHFAKMRPIELHVETLADRTAEEIRRLIDAGDIPPGTRLPSERELVARLRVSRTVVREALSSLEAIGLIVGQSTKGRYVAESRSSARSQSLIKDWLGLHTPEFSELDQIRQVLEPLAVRLTRAEDLKNVAARARTILDNQKAAIRSDRRAEAASEDADFHRVICSAAPNSMLRDLIGVFIEASRRSALAVYSIHEYAQPSMIEHSRIVRAAEQGDVASTARFLEKHLMRSSIHNLPATKHLRPSSDF